MSIAKKTVDGDITTYPSKIYIWSTFDMKTIQILEPKVDHDHLISNIFTMFVHPIYENIFVTAQAGRLYMWEIGNSDPICHHLETGACADEP